MVDRFFLRNGVPYSLNQLQIAEGFARGLQELTESELHLVLNSNVFLLTPQSVTRAQGKAALIKDGLWSGVIDYVESITDKTEKALAEVALNDTTHWQRSSPFLNSAAKSLGLSDEQLDDLFIQAEKIHL